MARAERKVPKVDPDAKRALVRRSQPLTLFERQFVDEVVATGRPVLSLRRLKGIKDDDWINADQDGVAGEARRLMSMPHVAAAILAEDGEALAYTAPNPGKVVEHLASIAFSNLSAFFQLTDDGFKLNLKGVTSRDMMAVKGIKVKRYLEGRGEDSQEVEITELQFHDKLAALKQLGVAYKLWAADGAPIAGAVATAGVGSVAEDENAGRAVARWMSGMAPLPGDLELLRQRGIDTSDMSEQGTLELTAERVPDERDE